MTYRKVVAALIDLADRLDSENEFAAADRVTAVARRHAQQANTNPNGPTDQQRLEQQLTMSFYLAKAVEAHRTSGNGWQVINQYLSSPGLTPESKNSLKQQFATIAETLKNDKPTWDHNSNSLSNPTTNNRTLPNGVQ